MTREEINTLIHWHREDVAVAWSFPSESGMEALTISAKDAGGKPRDVMVYFHPQEQPRSDTDNVTKMVEDAMRRLNAKTRSAGDDEKRRAEARA